jgi:hypothetical protein
MTYTFPYFSCVLENKAACKKWVSEDNDVTTNSNSGSVDKLCTYLLVA